MKIGAFLILRQRRRGQRFWVHPINTRRDELGKYHHLVQELRVHNDHFQVYFRMTPSQFDFLLSCIGPLIVKEDTNYRQSISAAEHLAICLR